MKKYILALVCCCLMLSGCVSGSHSAASTVFQGPWSGDPEVSESTVTADSMVGSESSDSGSVSQISKTELENADKNVWLFGKKILLPCRFEEFGENFSLDGHYFLQAGDDILAFLCYNGNVIGEVVLENCTADDPNKYAKRVVQLALGDSENNPVSTVGWHNNEIFFDVLGITMRSAPDEVTELLGEPTKKQQLSGNKLLVTYRISDEKFIEITYKDGKIVEFVIESR